MLQLLNLRACMFATSKFIGFMIFMYVLDCIYSLFRKDYK